MRRNRQKINEKVYHYWVHVLDDETTGPNNTVSIFPNPTGKAVCIKSTEAINSVQVTDAVRHVVSTGSYSTGKVSLNLTDYPAGLYRVSVNGVHVGRFVKI